MRNAEADQQLRDGEAVAEGIGAHLASPGELAICLYQHLIETDFGASAECAVTSLKRS
jgi:hypothetical protein